MAWFCRRYKGDFDGTEGRMRQGICFHAEARVWIEDAEGGSCSAAVRLRWRAKQELRGGEPFDDAHGSAADWAVP